MRRFAWLVVLSVAATGVGAVGFRELAPAQYRSTAASLAALANDLPEPVVVGLTGLVVVTVWVSVFLLLARAAYWCWKQVDSYVFRIWDLVLPESTIVRFGVGLTIMLLLLVVGPVVALQAADLIEDGEDVDERVVGNESNASDEENAADGPTNETNTTSYNSTQLSIGERGPFMTT